MRIIFKTDNDSVICEIHSDRYPIENYSFPFSFDQSDNCNARLLTHHLATTLSREIARIRKQEYEAGYKTGRQRKRKQKWFSGFLDD